MLGGCRGTSPYESMDSWAIRQNDIPPYATKYDVLYLYPQLIDWRVGENALQVHTTASDRLAAFVGDRVKDVPRKARLFVPLVHPDTAADDIEEAFNYYLNHYHDAGRPYVIIAEGEGAKAYAEARDELSGWLKLKHGYVFAFTDEERPLPRDGNELVDMAALAIRNYRYELTWGRPAPEPIVPVETNRVNRVNLLEALNEEGK